LVSRRAQVGINHQFGIVFDERTIDLHVLNHALNVFARFRDSRSLFLGDGEMLLEVMASSTPRNSPLVAA
jgi:hypothetical protein